jgi:hypothetical protein
MSERRPTKGDRDMSSKRCVLQCSLAVLVALSGGGGLAHGEPLNDEAALCAAMPKNLLPLNVSKETYRDTEEGPLTGGYAGHILVFTKFFASPPENLPSEGYVLFSGSIYPPGGELRLDGFRRDGVLASHDYFYGHQWSVSGLVYEPSLRDSRRPESLALTSTLRFLEWGKALDENWKAGSRDGLEYNYACQTCELNQSLPEKLHQDLRSARIAQFEDRTFIVTTKPSVVVAELRLPSPVSRYFQCSSATGREIDKSTDAAFQLAFE